MTIAAQSLILAIVFFGVFPALMVYCDWDSRRTARAKAAAKAAAFEPYSDIASDWTPPCA